MVLHGQMVNSSAMGYFRAIWDEVEAEWNQGVRDIASLMAVGGGLQGLAGSGRSVAAVSGVRQTAADRARSTLQHVRRTGAAPRGYKGGRSFANDGRNGSQVLPEKTGYGKSITYRYWDTNPHQPGAGRGGERLVTGSDGSAYYTTDHYRTFTPVP